MTTVNPQPAAIPALTREQRQAIAAARLVGLIRLGAGVVLGGAPRSFLRWERDIPQGSSMVLLMRTVGIRDLALGLGTLQATRADEADANALQPNSLPDLQRWVTAGLLSDALDVGAGLSSARTTGARGLASALVASPMVVLDLWALTAFS